MYDYESMSLSAWRAWIEILLKATTHQNSTRRSPLGERGLKSLYQLNHSLIYASLSAWRAWIEIVFVWSVSCVFTRRSPLGERGLKLLKS